MKRLISILLLLVSSCSFVYAGGFYVAGFSQSMSFEDAQKVAKSKGSYIERNSDYPVYGVKLNNINYDVYFCEPEGRLSSISYLFANVGDDGDRFLTFLRMTEQLEARYDIKIINANTHAFIGNDSKERGRVELFLMGDPSWYLELSLYGSREHGIHNAQAMFESTATTDNCL